MAMGNKKCFNFHSETLRFMKKMQKENSLIVWHIFGEKHLSSKDFKILEVAMFSSYHSMLT